MTKPVRMLNKYHIKEMLLHGNPQYENFYKEELIQFCKIAQEELKYCHENLQNLDNLQQELDQYKNNWEELKKWVKENSWYYNTSDGCQWVDQFKILNKMEELEENK